MRRSTWWMAGALGVLLAQPAHASKGQVNAGLLACSREDWPEAIDKMKEGLVDAEVLKPKQLMRARICELRAHLKLIEAAPSSELLQGAFDSFEQARTIDDPKALKLGGKELKELQDELEARLFNAAADAYNQKMPAEAAPRFEQAYAVGQNPRAAIMRGYSLQQLGDKQGAIEAYQTARAALEASDEAPDNAEVPLYEALGILLMEEGKSSEALAALAAGLERFPDNEPLQRAELAVYQRFPEAFDEARSRFDAALADSPDDLDLRNAWGSLLVAHGDEDEALGVFGAVLEKEPQNLVANLNLAGIHIARAKALQEQNQERRRPDKKVHAQMLDEMRAAYPFLQACHDVQPDNRAWLDQLVTVTSIVPELKGDMAKWKKRRDAL